MTNISNQPQNRSLAKAFLTIRSMAVASCLAAGSLTAMLTDDAEASSHREAPFITEMPKLDSTDFYMFRSYESGREGYVTVIANYLPLQDPFGGPNYFDLSPYGLYEIHIDNDGDSKEDLTFSFKFTDILEDRKVKTHDGTLVSVPLKNIGGIGPGKDDLDNVNFRQTYQVQITRGDRRKGKKKLISDASSGSTIFKKPVDYIGEKSFPDYESYANDHIHSVYIPGCGEGRVFVGQRQESFAVNLGPVFDLVNTNPLGPVDAFENPIGNKNITSIALELPISCVTDKSPVIGGWTSASVRQARVYRPGNRFGDMPRRRTPILHGGAWTQISRLGMPLVNEVVIGLKDKDEFNASEPMDDAKFLEYVQNPTFPQLLEILFGENAIAPTVARTDLISVFLLGLEGVNRPDNVKPAEMTRLNTDIAPLPSYQQENLGALANDVSGFPNGRRPGDDVVDITLRVAMGALLDKSVAPSNEAEFTDGVTVNAADFQEVFPYLNTPLPGASNY